MNALRLRPARGSGPGCYNGFYDFWSIGGYAQGKWLSPGGSLTSPWWSLALSTVGCTGSYMLSFIINGVTQQAACGATGYGAREHQVGWEFNSDGQFQVTLPGNGGSPCNSASGMEDYQPSSSTWYLWSSLTVTSDSSIAGLPCKMGSYSSGTNSASWVQG